MICLASWINKQVASILEDDKKGVLRPPSDSTKHGRAGLLEILEQKNVRFVPFSG
jgi:adrenodoxin-NADP+ reductase